MKIESKNIILLAGVILLLNSYGTINANAANSSTPETKSEAKNNDQKKDGTLYFTPQKRLEIDEEAVDDQIPG